jgi:hypothetical protein
VNPHAQLWSIRTDGECTHKQIENLVDIVLKMSEDIRIMRKDNKNLNIRVDHISVSECRCRLSATAGATCHEAPPPAANVNEPKSYRDVLIARSTYSIRHPTNPNNPRGMRVTSSINLVLQAGICDFGFATAVKKTGNKPGNIPKSSQFKDT